MRRRRVLLLVHEDQVPPDSIEGLSPEEINPFKVEYDVREALRDLGHEVRLLPLGDELAPIREAIQDFRPHVAFNLLLHFHGVGIYDAHVVSYLELLKTPYTGCNPRGLMLASDKALSKKILAYHRIPVPGFMVVPRGRKARAPRKLRFPLFVKSVAEHASMGISQASIVKDEEALQARVEFVHEHVGTDAIAEEYIEGRELTIGVLGNERLTTFPVWELLFRNLPEGSPAIQTSRVKWNLEYQKKIGLTSREARDLPEGAAERIAKRAKRIYRALGMSGYARIDMRMDAEGRAWVLEANPNPDLSWREDFAESAEAAGISYEELVERILRLGIRYRPAWKG